MKETLSTLSRKIGVSASTISRILSGKAEKYRISQKTVDYVMGEVKKIGYTPGFIAQELRAGKTHTIGILIPSVANPYFADIAAAIIAEAKNKGYSTILVDTMDNESNQNICLSTLVSRKVDGIIAAPCGKEPHLFEEVSKTIPVVLVDRYYEGSRLSYVTSNNFKGAKEATTYLLNSGHRNIACIQGDRDSQPNKRRVDGVKSAIAEFGNADVEYTISGDSFSIQSGYLETKLLMNRTPRPTAIFALSYTILLGVIKALQDGALHVPEDVSVISFDDNVCLDYFTPPVIRVSQPVEEMGRLATKMLIGKIENGTSSSTQLELSTSMIQGWSVKPLH